MLRARAKGQEAQRLVLLSQSNCMALMLKSNAAASSTLWHLMCKTSIPNAGSGSLPTQLNGDKAAVAAALRL